MADNFNIPKIKADLWMIC